MMMILLITFERMDPLEKQEAHGPHCSPELTAPQGLNWQDLCRGPLHIATYYIYKLEASWFQRRRFFFPYESMGDNDTRGVASLGPRDLIGRIYVGDH